MSDKTFNKTLYCQIYDTSRNKSQNLNVSCLVLQVSLPNPLKPYVENEDVVWAAPTGDAPTTSEWSNNFIAFLGGAYIRGLTVMCCNRQCALPIVQQVNMFCSKFC